MANQLSGQPGPSPRCHTKHQRYRQFARVRSGADQFSAFLAANATKLSILSSAVFADLRKNTADRITKASSTGQLS
jgi:hypothetical protein